MATSQGVVTRSIKIIKPVQGPLKTTKALIGPSKHQVRQERQLKSVESRCIKPGKPSCSGHDSACATVSDKGSS